MFYVKCGCFSFIKNLVELRLPMDARLWIITYFKENSVYCENYKVT